jgi:MraZ protein
MFFGEHEYKVDEKGRVPIPPKFRQEFQDGAMLGRGVDKCVSVYTPSEWKRVADNLSSNTGAPSKRRMMDRFLFGLANEAQLDGQGRVAIPATLREYAGIVGEAVVVGANDRIEIWGKDLWEAQKAEAEQQAWDITESLETK